MAPVIESLLPKGARHRPAVGPQLAARRAALPLRRPSRPPTRADEALLGLPEADRWRLGVLGAWRRGPHLLTYHQVWATTKSILAVLKKALPDGGPSALLQELADALLEASGPAGAAGLSSSLAVDWTDAESFARPPLSDGAPTADPEASWGHRRGDGPGQKDELFYGYYLSLATMAEDEGGPPVPELVRRATLTSCGLDPVPAMVPVLEGLPAKGVALGDVLADSGYAHRVAGNWALPLRCLGAKLVMDLHTNDRVPGAHFRAPIAATATCTAPLPPKCCSASSRPGATPAGTTSPPMTRKWPNFPATSSPAFLPTTKTAIPAWLARRRWGNCAARYGRRRWRCRTSAPRCSPHPSTRRPAVRKRPLPCRQLSTPRRSKNMITPRFLGGVPIPAGRQPSALIRP